MQNENNVENFRKQMYMVDPVMPQFVINALWFVISAPIFNIYIHNIYIYIYIYIYILDNH